LELIFYKQPAAKRFEALKNRKLCHFRSFRII